MVDGGSREGVATFWLPLYSPPYHSPLIPPSTHLRSMGVYSVGITIPSELSRHGQGSLHLLHGLAGSARCTALGRQAHQQQLSQRSQKCCHCRYPDFSGRRRFEHAGDVREGHLRQRLNGLPGTGQSRHAQARASGTASFLLTKRHGPPELRHRPRLPHSARQYISLLPGVQQTVRIPA